MALFAKRPLALGCFLFLLASLAAGYFPMQWTLWGILLFAALAALLFSIRPLRQRLFGLGLCLAVIALSLCHSFVGTELGGLQTKDMTGKRMVLCEVLEGGSTSSYSAGAVVRLLNLDGEAVRVKSYLNCDFPLELSVGDQIYAYATVERYEVYSDSIIESRKESDGILLSISVENEADGQIRRLSEQRFRFSMLFEENGLRILMHRAREGLRSYLYEALGEEMGAIANGFFVGDSSGIARETILSFRRAGVMHLLSVSGLHLTVLLGAIELLLRGLILPKRWRVALISLCSLLLLILTGFSASACRAVLMLLAVYYRFMLAEECDGITSLFASVALIVLISPYSVNDLGLWMSFLATLGLLSVYPVWDSAICRIKAGKGWRGRLVRTARGLLSGFLLTATANLFLLPITWWYFGELSWIGLPCNVAISFVSALFLVSIPILLLLGPIPLLGELARLITAMLGTLVKGIAEQFSRVPNGVVSLRYAFSAVIVLTLSAVMIVLLLLRLRKRWLLAIPPLVAVGAFLICLGVRGALLSQVEAVYLQRDSSAEVLYWKENQRLAILDVSSGGWRGASAVLEAYEDSYATEIETLALSHWHTGHPSMIELLSERTVLRRLLLPEPRDREEAELCEQILALARDQYISVALYSSGEPILLWDGVVCYAERQAAEKHDGIALTAVCGEERLLYLSSGAASRISEEAPAERIGQSKTVILGAHGGGAWESRVWRLGGDHEIEQVIYACREAAELLRLEGFGGKTWIPTEGKRTLRFVLSPS